MTKVVVDIVIWKDLLKIWTGGELYHSSLRTDDYNNNKWLSQLDFYVCPKIDCFPRTWDITHFQQYSLFVIAFPV